MLHTWQDMLPNKIWIAHGQQHPKMLLAYRQLLGETRHWPQGVGLVPRQVHTFSMATPLHGSLQGLHHLQPEMQGWFTLKTMYFS